MRGFERVATVGGTPALDQIALGRADATTSTNRKGA
jgi:hypothetical protein